MHQFVLAGEHKALSSLLFCRCNGRFQQLPSQAAPPVFRQRVDPKDHLPCTVFVVERGICVHCIGQVCRVRDHAVHKSCKRSVLPQEPEMISIMPQPLGKFCTGRRLCRREALCLHCRDGVEILLDCGSNRLCHGFSLPFSCCAVRAVSGRACGGDWPSAARAEWRDVAAEHIMTAKIIAYAAQLIKARWMHKPPPTPAGGGL